MVFNSIPFVVFALIFFLAWKWMNKKDTSRWTFLVVMSLMFYGWWDWRFLFLIIGSGLIDYFSALAIAKYQNRRRFFLVASLLGNLGGLAFFKYYKLIAASLDWFFYQIGSPTDFKDTIPEITVVGVVGISFYTFQSLSYTIDVYRGRLAPTKNILHFFSYLVMFPQLVAGPIVRAKDMLHQLCQHRIASDIQKWNGIKLFAFGLFQKTVLADNIGYLVNRAYSPSNMETGSGFWAIVMCGFAFQIYCDFSGYSLMARGLAKYMGFHLKMNFNHPYLSGSFKSFWSRWHISLSTWFRDYVYIAMGGSKRGVFLGLVFMTITMVISGLWHGAWFTFLGWGLLHAGYLAFERITGWHKLARGNVVYSVFRILVVFIAVTIAWNLFRAESLDQAKLIYTELFSFESGKFIADRYYDALFFLVLAVFIEMVYACYHHIGSLKEFYRRKNLDILFTSLAIVLSLFFRGPASEFIYFQF